MLVNWWVDEFLNLWGYRLVSWWVSKFLSWWDCELVSLLVFELVSCWVSKFVSWWDCTLMSLWVDELMYSGVVGYSCVYKSVSRLVLHFVYEGGCLSCVDITKITNSAQFIETLKVNTVSLYNLGINDINKTNLLARLNPCEPANHYPFQGKWA